MSPNSYFRKQKPNSGFVTVCFGPGNIRYISYFDLKEVNVASLELENQSISQSYGDGMKVLNLGAPFNVDEECGYRPRYRKMIDPNSFASALKPSVGSFVSVYEKVILEFRSTYFSCRDYWLFARELRLTDLRLDEFRESWCSAASDSHDVRESYRGNKEFHFLSDKGRESVFRKTPFFNACLAKTQASIEESKLKASTFNTFVYLMEDQRNNLVKIGKSIHPATRERTLQSEEPNVVLRFAIPCDQSMERTLHLEFQEHRVRGEWFKISKTDCVLILRRLVSTGDLTRAIIPDEEWISRVFLSSCVIPAASKMPEQSPTDFARLHFITGNLAFQNKNYIESIKAYSESLKINPYFSLAYSNRGIAKTQIGEFQSALADHDFAIHHSPESHTAFKSRGATRLIMREYTLAINDFNRALEICTSDMELFEKRGIANYKIGKFDDAISDYDKAIEIDPSEPSPHFNRGVLFLRTARISEAISEFDVAIRLGSNAAIVSKAFSLTLLEPSSDEIKELATLLAQKAATENLDCPYTTNAVSCALALNSQFDAAILKQKIAMKNRKWLKDDDIDGGSYATERIDCWKAKKQWKPKFVVVRV